MDAIMQYLPIIFVVVVLALVGALWYEKRKNNPQAVQLWGRAQTDLSNLGANVQREVNNLLHSSVGSRIQDEVSTLLARLRGEILPPAQPVQVPSGYTPLTPAGSPGLSSVYVDRDDLMKSIGASGTAQAVTLNGQTVHGGFGPPIEYTQRADGSIVGLDTRVPTGAVVVPSMVTSPPPTVG